MVGALRRTTTIEWIGGTLLPGAVAFSIALPLRVNVLITITASLFYFFYAAIFRQSMTKFFRSSVFVLVAAHICIQIVGLLYTSDVKEGLQQMERWGFALLVPFLVFLMIRWNVTGSRLIFNLMAGCIAVSVYALVRAAFLPEVDRAIVFSEGHTELADIISIHPMYLGMFFCFCLFFCLEYMRASYRGMTLNRRLVFIVLVVYLVAIILLLRSQVILLVLVLMLILYSLVLFRRRAALVAFFLFGVGFVIYLVDVSRKANVFDVYGKNVSSAVDNRLKIWQSAGMAIRDAPWFGNGTGGEQNALNRAYHSLGYDEGIQFRYNAHNQYLQFIIRNGIIELAVFMTLLVYSFWVSLRSNDYTFLLFNMMVSMVMVIESSLSVQKGIVFFYFIIAVFVFLPWRGPASSTPDSRGV